MCGDRYDETLWERLAEWRDAPAVSGLAAPAIPALLVTVDRASGPDLSAAVTWRARPDGTREIVEAVTW